VPQRTAKQLASRIRLLNRKLDSPRNDALEFGFALEIFRGDRDQPDGGGDADGEEADEVLSDGRFRERVDRTDDAGARQERAVDTKEERGRDQDHVPDLHHALLFLHHYGVQEGGGGEPREKRSVLNRVPHPIAAPSENVIGQAEPSMIPVPWKSQVNDGPARVV